MHDPLSHVLAFVVDHPWALSDEWRPVLAGILARKLAGEAPDPATVQAAMKVRSTRPDKRAEGGVAVIPIQGVLAPRMNLFSAMSGGASFEGLTRDLEAALATNPKAIVLDVNSPGGNVAGAREFARALLKARAKVPIVAVAEHLMASAAYWVGSCATEVTASPSALVGSVGVFTMYDDVSAALEKLGIKREVFAAGKFKGEGVDGGTLTDEARAHRLATVDKYYSWFVEDIAIGRGTSAETVRAGYGQGRLLTSDAALAAGMVTRIATLDETLERFGAPRTAGDADADFDPFDATAQEPSSATAQERRRGLESQLVMLRSYFDYEEHHERRTN
jgi:signal peptide peptidase SppA